MSKQEYNLVAQMEPLVEDEEKATPLQTAAAATPPSSDKKTDRA